MSAASSLYALVLANNGGVLNENGYTLNVGSNTSGTTAGVIFNGLGGSNAETGIYGGTLAFGASEGIIALQLHTGPAMKVEFKDIEIAELP